VEETEAVPAIHTPSSPDRRAASPETQASAGGPAIVAPPPAQRSTHDGHAAAEPPLTLKPRRRAYHLPWRTALAVALVVVTILLIARRAAVPPAVEVVHPQRRLITETVAASGRVAGRRETIVGSPVPGTVAELWVDEGDVVRRGQPLARIENDVAQAQVRQAAQALQTARAGLAQAAAGPRSSELNAARAQVAQAEATVNQRQAQLAQSRAAVTQAEARRVLAQQNLERNHYLFHEGAIARQTVDQAVSEEKVAVAEVIASRDAVTTAQANLAAAQAGVTAAREQLRTLAAGPRSEAVEVARQRVRDAEAALQVAREQAQNAIIRAPFAGTVTEILSELGAPVANNGVVRLVQTGLPEIRLDVDESNLADLKVGQRAVITSSTYRTARLDGRVSEIGAQVDPARGTVQIKVVADHSPAWLRSGETVNVNIIAAQDVPRLVIPSTAVRMQGDTRVVLVVHSGQVVVRPVVLGAVEGETVPVLDGLSSEDQVVRYADQAQPGARVRVKG
jgi:HlyD family secretion protein